jgi:peptidoglycan/LPS O-acetylase OafA/YrhL/cellulose synthase/poly-beta-1,6-N-acetylglucosamine synthase-like glycosyltransferase
MPLSTPLRRERRSRTQSVTLDTESGTRVDLVERTEHLPSPPTDAEKFLYMGRQHRWLLWVQALSFSLIAYSILRFSTSSTTLLLFLVPMSLYAIALVISLLSSGRKKRTSLRSHAELTSSYAPSTHPSVDVFLPSAGEPLDVLTNTFTHVAALEWPGALEVHVLDDSARDEVRLLAERFGFTYRTRPDRGHLKKAGNLKFGYDNSRGDLIAIFDADFVPRTDFLSELVPYFEADPSIGIVQSPQYFDTTHGRAGMNWLQRAAGSTQELFYRWIQPARDRSGAAICVGTCALYRRAGLERSGGFAQIGHSEDVHTGVNLLKVGFRVQYVPVLVSKGLCPDTISGFLNQQYRWCSGSMSLLADKSFHDKAGLSWRQRTCFWAGFLYYVGTAVNAFVAPLPTLVMLYHLPSWIQPGNSVWLLGALVLWFVVLPLTFRSRWRIEVLRVQLLYSYAHALAVLHTLTGRTRDWVATGAANSAKRSTPLATSVMRTIVVYVTLTQLAVVTGLVLVTAQLGIERTWAMAFFGAVQAYVQWPVAALAAKTLWATREPAPLTQRFVAARSLLANLRNRPARVLGAASGMAGSTDSAVGLRRWRPDIQGLRAAAVAAVVLYHASVPYVTGGYVGVDVFFVISGFLITGHLLREASEKGRISLSSFWANRVKRLLPMAALVLVVTLAVARLWGSVFQVRSISFDALFSAIYAVNYRFAFNGVQYQEVSGPESPLQHYWSLALEEQFYLVWPLLVLACLVLFRKRFRAAVALVTALVLAGSLYASVVVTGSNAPMGYFSLHTRAWELAAGAALALAAPWLARELPRTLSSLLSWVGVGMITWAVFAFDDRTAFPSFNALLPVLGAALVILAGCRPGRRSAEVILARSPMQGLGKVSYAFYLWHWPILVLAPVLLGTSLSWVENLQLVALGLWLSVVSYWTLESSALRSKWERPAWLTTGGALSASAAGAAVVVALTMPSLTGTGTSTTVALTRADVTQVQAALLAGTRTTAAPANLAPSPIDAHDDQPASTYDGCHAGYLEVEQGSCVYGDPAGASTLVLYGDSHAQQWLPALDAAAKQEGWKVVAWTKAACPVASMDVFSDELNREYTECASWRTRTEERIKDLDPALVVVSQSDAVPGSVSNSDWADDTATTMTRMRDEGLPLVYVLDTPYPGENVAECVATNLDDVGACTLEREDVLPYDGRQETVGSTLGSAGFTTIDPLDWFCGPQDCPAVVGNVLVYRDATHMSATFSNWLAPMVAPLMEPAEAPVGSGG